MYIMCSQYHTNVFCIVFALVHQFQQRTGQLIGLLRPIYKHFLLKKGVSTLLYSYSTSIQEVFEKPFSLVVHSVTDSSF